MTNKYKILFLGASYGSLLAIRMVMAGHDATMVCLPDEVAAFNENGATVRFPVRGRDGLVEVNSKNSAGTLNAISPRDADPADYDLICLAMQEPQYRFEDIKSLLRRIGEAGKPCMSIMNMPPLAFLKRIDTIDHAAIEKCYADPRVWDAITPEKITLCSPDPQAFRPPEDPVNVLQVTLPTNFKAARFASDKDTAILRNLQADIEGFTLQSGDEEIVLPVKLKVHDSIFVPLAKWAMLLTGNYRCITDGPAQSIRDAVHSDIEKSRSIYEWVVNLCVELGADAQDMVPFDKYANAATGLLKPSSAARAIYAGAPYIERVDCLVHTIAGQMGLKSDAVAMSVELVDSRLKENRAAAKS